MILVEPIGKSFFDCKYWRKYDEKSFIDLWNQDKKNNFHVIFLLLTIIVAGFYISMISMKSFSIFEGWYSVYAKGVNSGLIPYKDFEFLFTPLYLNIITLITKIFGYKIFVLRIIGIFVYLAITILIYSILRKFFIPVISMVATLSTILFLQTESLFVTYDYIRFYDIFTYSCLLLLLMFWYSLDKGNKKKSILYALFSGCFAGLSFLVRQNSGAIYIFYCVLALLIIAILTKNKKVILQGTGFLRLVF